MKLYWRAPTAFFLVIWLTLMIGGRSRFLRDPGTFWHTVVGRQMLSSGDLIYQDTFSFTFAGQTWSPHQWLGECFMAALDYLGGLDALLVATTVILSCLYTWLALRMLEQGFHWILAATVIAIAVAASSGHFHIRPHIGTMVFLAITQAFLIDFEAHRMGVRSMFWLVPVYLLWTNIHGGMLGGLATIGLAGAGWSLTAYGKLRSPIRRTCDLGGLTLVFLLCAATALINPYGWRLPQIWLEIMDSPVLPQIIQEHAPLSPYRMDGAMVLLLAGIYLFVLLGTRPSDMRLVWLLPLVWLYLACQRVRHAPLFSVMALLVIADAFPRSRWAALLTRSGSDLFLPPSVHYWPSTPVGLWLILPTAVVLMCLAVQVGNFHLPIVGRGWARLDPDYWPTELDGLLSNYEGAESHPTRIFNEYLFGGYLIYFHPGYRVWVDDRCELYGDRWLQEYVSAETGHAASYFRDAERWYPSFDLALTRTGSGYDDYFARSQDWRTLRRTATASFYRRQGESTHAGEQAAAQVRGIEGNRTKNPTAMASKIR